MPEDEVFPGTTRARSSKALKRTAVSTPPEESDAEYIDDWDGRPVIVKTSSGVKECFRIGALAKAWDNRTVQSIYKLERNGTIPKAPYRKHAPRGRRKGDRLYTRAQVELIVRLAQEFGVYKRNTRKKIDNTGFPAELLKQWPT